MLTIGCRLRLLSQLRLDACRSLAVSFAKGDPEAVAADAVFTSAPPVPQPSVHEGVLHYLRKLIITRELAPGAKIPLDAVAPTCGVSPVPVREALRQLQNEGVV